MDYGLNCIIGDLNEVKNYENLYSNWLSNNLDKFISGKLSPCTKCEYYQKISLISIVMLYDNYHQKIDNFVFFQLLKRQYHPVKLWQYLVMLPQ